MHHFRYSTCIEKDERRVDINRRYRKKKFSNKVSIWISFESYDLKENDN